MERFICEFFRDDEPSWVARLACGHSVHMRHQPPFKERPWVLSPEGRQTRLGSAIDCVACDRLEMPALHEPYRQTPSFTEDTVPKALMKAHSTKPGVWGLVHVERGRLEYERFAPLAGTQQLTPEIVGVIPPELEHKVTPLGAVAFHVEFWRQAQGQGPGQGAR